MLSRYLAGAAGIILLGGFLVWNTPMTPETEPDTFVLSADDATIARQEPVYEAPDVDKQPDARVASQMSAIDARTDSVRR